MAKKILLIAPPCQGSNIRFGENLGIRYICSFLLRHGYDASILECGNKDAEINEIVSRIHDYDIIGFSLNYSGQYRSAKEIIKKYLELDNKSRIGLHTQHKFIAGGHYATFQYEFILRDCPQISYVICGEAENIMLQLAHQSFNNFEVIPNIAFRKTHEIFLTSGRIDKVNINDFPFPFRDNNSFFLNQKHFSMITSRGCYANCSFCSVSSFSKITGAGTKWRLRSAENIIDEINEIQKKYNVDTISFLDSTFIGQDYKSINRINRFCELLEKEKININFSIECRANAVDEKLFAKLVKFGLKNVFIGVESGTDYGLKLYNKGVSLHENQIGINILNKLKIDSQFGFINFFPEMEIDDFIKNIEFLHKNCILTSKALASRLCIYHGTAYADRDLPQVQLNDNNFEIIYTFNDERINTLSRKCKKYARLIEPYEIALSKKLFEINTSTTSNSIAHQIISSINETKRMIDSILFYIGRELYYNIYPNDHLQSFDKHEKHIYRKLSHIKKSISNINQLFERR